MSLNRSLWSIFCSSILDYDYDARQKIDRVLVPRRDAADPALRIAVAGWAVTSGCGMSNLIRFGINRNLQSIFCSSILDNDYDARQKTDRAAPTINRYRYRYRVRYRYRNIMVFSHELQKNHLDRISAILTRHESTRLLHSARHPGQPIGNRSIAIASERTNPGRR